MIPPKDVWARWYTGMKTLRRPVGTLAIPAIATTGALHFTHTFDAAPPAVWRHWPPVRFTACRVLAEEHHWRATQTGAVRGWNVAVLGAGRAGPLTSAAAGYVYYDWYWTRANCKAAGTVLKNAGETTKFYCQNNGLVVDLYIWK
ncbi:hypothetical protein [Streptomyces torulosus]|uniref:hypothetical protein n=1 Tax=Streptomyces torulosus TaxID=68276 RepID=UPI0006EB6321|nr:hypothetical protein [Streptomyces torulosus]